jgi:lysozyme family protein
VAQIWHSFGPYPAHLPCLWHTLAQLLLIQGCDNVARGWNARVQNVKRRSKAMTLKEKIQTAETGAATCDSASPACFAGCAAKFPVFFAFEATLAERGGFDVA